MYLSKYVLPTLILVLLSTCQTDQNMTLNYQLGTAEGFCEMVRSGAKKLALSPPLRPEEMDRFYPRAKEIADRYGVEVFLDQDFIPSDLFPADVAEGKEVMLFYRGNALDQYLSLKGDLIESGLSGASEAEKNYPLARRFGRLLGYSPPGINRLLAQNTSFRALPDFGVEAMNVFFYYRDLDRATRFYRDVLGLELVADYGMATTFRIAEQAFLILVDAEYGMHDATEPKSVALALLTDDLEEWWTYLNDQDVPVKYPLKVNREGPHDGFVMIDPEGYLLEFERFRQHPENENFMPQLINARTLTVSSKENDIPEGLGFKAAITWLYYRDVLAMQRFYEDRLGLELVADQGWTKIYQGSPTGFIGLVDEARGMRDFAEEKAVTLSFFMEDLDGWFDYVKTHQVFPLRTDSIETGPEGKYRAFVGYDPAGYFMEFDRFYEHPENDRLLDCLPALE